MIDPDPPSLEWIARELERAVARLGGIAERLAVLTVIVARNEDALASLAGELRRADPDRDRGEGTPRA